MTIEDLQNLLGQYLPQNVNTNTAQTASAPLLGTGNTNGQLGTVLNTVGEYLPYLNQQTASSIVPNAIAQQEASVATAPINAELLQQIYSQYGPQLASLLQNTTNSANNAAAAGTAATANSAAGQANLQAMIAANKAANPEYYAGLTTDSNAINNLIGSIDLSGNLSGSQNRAIGQSLAQQNAQTGNLNSPSQSQTVSNAMNYGNAVYNRQEQAKSDLSSAISQATSFLPQAQTGVNANTAWGAMTGTSGTNAANSATSLLNPSSNPASSGGTTTSNNLASSGISAGGGVAQSQNALQASNTASSNALIGSIVSGLL